MKPAVLWMILWLGWGMAHPVDELVQAAYINLEPQQVTLELDLTPGEKVGGAMLKLLDTNQNGQLEETEGKDYAHSLLSQLSLKLDGQPINWKFQSMALPQAKVMVLGGGTMRLIAQADLDAPAGPHTLEFANHHAPLKSAYLANVFVQTTGLEVSRQQRNPDQSQYQVEYIVQGQYLPVLPILLGLGGVVGVAWLYWRRQSVKLTR